MSELHRRFSAPAHCMDEDFLADIAARGVKIVNLREAPYNVVFEGAAAALREVYAEHWGGDEFPGFDA